MAQQPSSTLYIQNLGPGLKTQDLKRSLYHLFSAHGKVLDVVASRAPGMNDQAFVVFKDMAAATAARRREDGNPFLGKRMRIFYAKAKSHATIKEEEGPEALYLYKMGLHDTKTEKLTVSGAEKALEASKAQAKRELEGQDEDDEEQPPAKKGRVDADGDEAPMEEDESDEEGPAPNAAPPALPEIPHHVLYVTDLPPEADQEVLSVLFQQWVFPMALMNTVGAACRFPGFVTVRYSISSQTAYVYFENWSLAQPAKEATNQFQIKEGHYISVKFADRSVV